MSPRLRRLTWTAGGLALLLLNRWIWSAGHSETERLELELSRVEEVLHVAEAVSRKRTEFERDRDARVARLRELVARLPSDPQIDELRAALSHVGEGVGVAVTGVSAGKPRLLYFYGALPVGVQFRARDLDGVTAWFEGLSSVPRQLKVEGFRVRKEGGVAYGELWLEAFFLSR